MGSKTIYFKKYIARSWIALLAEFQFYLTVTRTNKGRVVSLEPRTTMLLKEPSVDVI